MRKGLMIAGGVVLLLIVAVVAVAMLVDADQFRPAVERQATYALGRQVTIGKLKMALLSGGVAADNLTIADDPQFSGAPFLTAASMNIGVDLKALIFDRKLNVESFVIRSPKLNLVENARGQWNYSSLGSRSAQNQTPSAGAAPEFAVGKFILDDGAVTVRNLGSGRTSEYSKLQLEAKDIALTSAIPYEFSATAPGGGTVDVKGTFGPLAEQAERTPMTAQIAVRGFDIAATGFSDPGSPLKGRVDVDADLKSDGVRTEVDAKLTGKQMCLAAGCTPSATPIGIDAKANYLLADRVAKLTSGLLKFGNSAADLSGTVDLKGAKPMVNARIDASNLAVSDIESALPALGIVLPPGARLEGGTASVHATATGPADALLIQGHVGLLNSKVTGYDLGSKMAVITKLSGVSVGKETVIQEFSSDVQQGSAGSKMDNILLVVPGIGRLTGAGTVGKQNDLNFAMRAQVDISKSPVGEIGSMLGRKNMNVGVPFHITGTTKDPKFTPDFAKGLPGSNSAGNLAQTVQGVSGKAPQGITQGLSGLGGLFGKKK
jgi:AsmA protein